MRRRTWGVNYEAEAHEGRRLRAIAITWYEESVNVLGPVLFDLAELAGVADDRRFQRFFFPRAVLSTRLFQ